MTKQNDQLDNSPLMITDDNDFREHCLQWQSLPFITLDTEFVRTRTFYPQIGLIQLNDGQRSYLIDPLSIADFTAFKQLLTSPSVIKVFHSCSEDLEVFRYFLDVLVAPVFDTQIAYAFLQSDGAISYQRLVKELVGRDLDKSETRSDWLARPLQHKQIIYAQQDVEFLPAIYEQLTQKLSLKGCDQWCREECDQLLTLVPNGVNEDYYLKIKSVWRLRRHELAILKRLCQWRELQARERDIPRSFIFKDHQLWDIARHKPKNIKQLARVQGVSQGALDKDGEQVLTVVDDAMALNVEDCPAQLAHPLPPQAGKVMKDLKAQVRKVAEQFDMAADMLARKRHLEALLKSGYPNGPYQLPEALCGWRKAVIGDQLQEALSP